MSDLKSEIQSHIQSGRSFLVIGLGRSGAESSRFLRRLGAKVVCIEQRSREDFLKTKDGAETVALLEREGVLLSFENSVPDLSSAALAVLSPGVPLHSEIPRILRDNKVRLISEFELGILLSGAPAIVVTGTNGKSTTVSLLQKMCNIESSPTILCGNIGTPVVSVLEEAGFFSSKEKQNIALIVESSSYQLEASVYMKPKIGVLLNLSENHLERHGTMESYLEAKKRLFQNQDASDYAVLNRNDTWVWPLAEKIASKAVPVGVDFSLEEFVYGARIEYFPSKGIDRIIARYKGKDIVFEASGSLLIGFHNRFNLAAALITALLHGVSVDHLNKCIRTFSTLEHRLERVPSEGKLIINDSKATTVTASVTGLSAVREAFPKQTIKLMLGGLAKTGSWTPLVNLVKREGEFVRVMTFGKDGKRISEIFREAGLPVIEFSTLKNAALYGKESLKPDEILLLSPGCLSFDEFTDFEDRGRAFKSYLVDKPC